MSKGQASQRPHEKAGGEHTERREERGHAVACGKKQMSDDSGEVAVHAEVVPLHHVAGESREDDGLLCSGRSTRHWRRSPVAMNYNRRPLTSPPCLRLQLCDGWLRSGDQAYMD